MINIIITSLKLNSRLKQIYVVFLSMERKNDQSFSVKIICKEMD